MRFWCQVGSILAQKSTKFQQKVDLKKHQNFDRFWYRYFIDFGANLASNLGPTWRPRRPKIRKNGSKKLSWCSQNRVRNTTFNFNTVLDRLGLDFGGSWGGFWDPRRPQDPPKTPLRRPEPPLRRPQTPQRRPKPPPRRQELAKAKKQPKTKPRTKPYPRRPKT